MKAFIKCILGFTHQSEIGQGGILGHVSGYYGCVEAQGRGSLHCHMLIWLHGALNPNEIKDKVLSDGGHLFRQRLIDFLDDTISSEIIRDPDPQLEVQSSSHHACSVRQVNLESNNPMYIQACQKDKHNLSKACQTHRHTFTCYKYWRGPPEPRECRFNLDKDNINPVTYFDDSTGELHLRKLDGLVNNFIETVMEAVRCNTDVNFVGSGPFAKAVMYYITDYITKTQLKAHVAYAALEIALKNLEPSLDPDDELTVRAKRLLQRCSYAMINQQELSAQQVVSYLLDFEDHFTSHSFANLYWTTFEHYIELSAPSTVC
ncbi:hypothetical protein EV361DRAFT_767071, partial [Lentinula raphanica]